MLFSRKKDLRLESFFNSKASILNIASTKLVTCYDTDPLERVIPVLATRFRRVPVIGRNGHFRGFITAIDVLDYLGAGPKYSLFAKRRGSLKIPVKSIMETNVHIIDRRHSVKKALEAFHHQKKGAYPITHRGKLIGIISDWDFIRHIDSPIGITVEELMVRKPLIVRDTFSILDAAKIMVRSGTRRLPVARDNILLGIVTPSDILSYLLKNSMLNSLRRDKTRITKVMNSDVSTLDPGLDVYEAAKIMKEKRIGGLPVVEDSELLGILTERDIVNALRY